jgi:cation diffusion facilitator CzcD-associated flavoprotein CzcO
LGIVGSERRLGLVALAVIDAGAGGISMGITLMEASIDELVILESSGEG